jgi:hypothetical protein
MTESARDRGIIRGMDVASVGVGPSETFVLPATLAWFSARSESERLRPQARTASVVPEPTRMGYERERRAPPA